MLSAKRVTEGYQSSEHILTKFRNRKTTNRILTPQMNQHQFIYHESVSLKSVEVSQ